MYLESQAMCLTMLQLMHEQIPSLAVHDSIIVPLSAQHDTTRVLTKWYRVFAKATPVLVPHFPDGYQEPPLSTTDDNLPEGAIDPKSSSGVGDDHLGEAGNDAWQEAQTPTNNPEAIQKPKEPKEHKEHLGEV